MSSTLIGRIVWRLATPWDVHLASLSRPTMLTDKDKSEIRAKLSSDPKLKLDKPRPYGMVIVDENSKECVVYSRTADENAKPNGLSDLEHLSHGVSCGIDKRGVVQLAKYYKMQRRYWDSKAKCKPTLTENNCFLLLCYCEQKACRKRDKLLLQEIQTIENIAKSGLR